MLLWTEWFRCVLELRKACSRNRTFLWMCLVLVGFSIRTELLGVSSFVRSCFLRPEKLSYHVTREAQICDVSIQEGDILPQGTIVDPCAPPARLLPIMLTWAGGSP